VTWNRTDATQAVVAALQAGLGATVFVFDKPPATLNPPAVVVGRPDVTYATAAYGVDQATLPVLCVGAVDGEDTVDGLITGVRAALAEPSLGGAVNSCVAAGERNWRNVTVAGAELLQAEVTLTIRM
jgi:hypothetical protein